MTRDYYDDDDEEAYTDDDDAMRKARLHALTTSCVSSGLTSTPHTSHVTRHTKVQSALSAKPRAHPRARGANHREAQDLCARATSPRQAQPKVMRVCASRAVCGDAHAWSWASRQMRQTAPAPAASSAVGTRARASRAACASSTARGAFDNTDVGDGTRIRIASNSVVRGVVDDVVESIVDVASDARRPRPRPPRASSSFISPPRTAAPCAPRTSPSRASRDAPRRTVIARPNARDNDRAPGPDVSRAIDRFDRTMRTINQPSPRPRRSLHARTHARAENVRLTRYRRTSRHPTTRRALAHAQPSSSSS